MACLPAGAAAQRDITVQGVASAEGWATDSGSVLLARNHGRPGLVGRLNLWGAAGLGGGFTAYAAGSLEGGSARHEPGTEWYTDIAAIRFTRSDALVVDAGKMPHPVGSFAPRRYPDRNPLVGVPDAYPVQYPWGIQLSGVRGGIDYRAGMISLPLSDERYLPAHTPTARPVLGIGFTPSVGMRLGVTSTWGPYLGDALSPAQLAGRRWRDYQQRVVAVDGQVSRGYVEVRGELATARYEVPGAPGAPPFTVHGFAWWGEGRYALSPRLFVAARVERNEYAYIQPRDDGAWIASPTNMYNAEVGAGWRIGARTLMKASARGDRWRVAPELRSDLPDGFAIALQLSRRFDILAVTVGP